jgi:hypothetical protein
VGEQKDKWRHGQRRWRRSTGETDDTPNRNGHSGRTADGGERREETDGGGSELFDE